ncbi:AAA family ATPase [Candidatus Micrarchaeota archaeon]|nr:AAA family ATPase [Candidatus Micrarchaeota archaeon]
MKSEIKYENIKTTESIPIPNDPLEQVIGQDEAVKIAKLAARQKRHLLLVGPPGIGKSLLAQSIAFHLIKPTQEISVLHNPENPERPIVEIKTSEILAKEKTLEKQLAGKIVDPKDVPSFVAEKLGFRCRKCNYLSKPQENSCPSCGTEKFKKEYSPFGDLISDYFAIQKADRVHTTKMNDGGREEIIVYEKYGEKIRVLDQKSLEKIDEIKQQKPRKILIPSSRKNFIIATGASETELLGDIRHDPYGGHQQLGTQPYSRVVAGAIHEAHEGVLFIDELGALSYLQRFLFTAMQERKYSIVGRNPQSSGASVKVDSVPCDFILIAASNINDLHFVLPPLRSRIIGNGYEVLLDTHMPDTETNRGKMFQFIAQEIRKDGKIPHATLEAAHEIIEESKRRAKLNDDAPDALTLRLRDLSGAIRLAGDIAIDEGAPYITPEFVKLAIRKNRNIEEQLKEKYGSVWRANASELSRPEKRDYKEIN